MAHLQVTLTMDDGTLDSKYFLRDLLTDLNKIPYVKGAVLANVYLDEESEEE